MKLFENDVLVALDKPAGVSMATSTREEKSAARVVARLLEACGEDPAELLLLVHRLDVGTSGVVLLAKSDAAHRTLSLAFQSRAAKKTYRALAWGHPTPARGVYEDLLGRDPKDGRKMKVVRAGGKAAVTRYETLARLPSISDLRLFPETGRTHQLRVHLAAIGHPIVADATYGRGRAELAPGLARQALHAASISFRHPVSNQAVAVRAPLPEDLSAALRALRERPSGG